MMEITQMFDKKSRCYKGGKQHKYSPRYSEAPTEGSINVPGPVTINVEALRKLVYYKKYLFDICEWCGDIKGEHHMEQGF